MLLMMLMINDEIYKVYGHESERSSYLSLISYCSARTGKCRRK
jgi:hypothetical protein